MPVKDIPEYLGYQSIKNESGRNIFTSYWESKEAISDLTTRRIKSQKLKARTGK